MQSAAASRPYPSTMATASVRSCPELAALLDHVQRSIEAIEIAGARDASSEGSERVDDVVVLDDVKTSALLTKSAPKLAVLSGRGQT
jgi:hypothetical protein